MVWNTILIIIIANHPKQAACLNGKTWFIYCVKHKSNYKHGQSPKTSCMSSGKTWFIYCVIYKSNYNPGQPHKTNCICCNLLSYHTKTTKRCMKYFWQMKQVAGFKATIINCLVTYEIMVIRITRCYLCRLLSLKSPTLVTIILQEPQLQKKKKQ